MRAVNDTSAQPLVSFIIPVRNEEKTIGACLDAISDLNCDRRLWECVVVDNGSGDETVKISREKGASVFSLPDVTISALRNFGAKKSRGGFLGFVDADCVIDREWVRNALARFRDPKVACVGSYPSIPEDSSWVQRAWALQNRRTARLEDVDWLPSMNILVRESAFFEVGGFNESLTTCEDVDFCYRLKKRGYRIISDRNIKAIHYGEARTVLGFFKKERWRGQSNLQGLLSHGFYWRELPSLILPLLYLILMICMPVTLMYLINGPSRPLLINVASILLPPAVLSLRTSLRVGDFTHFARLAYLYLVYSIARTAAIIPVESHSRDSGAYA
jgi:glycosyltransferase involved in cell wall biosynthesis